MNDGIIASRYAKALLKLVDYTGGGPVVYRQAAVLFERLRRTEGLLKFVTAPAPVPDGDKLDLIASAISEEPADELMRVMRLVIKNNREDIILLVINSFIRQYRSSRRILSCSLVTASPAPGLEQRLREFVGKEGYTAEMVTSIDPQIIGGFIFSVDDGVVDASVRRQLDDLRREFKEKNRRII